MNSQEAKAILEFYRPGRDEVDARVAEALQLVESDPSLSRWWRAQLKFDQMMSATVHEIAVPADLKAALLAAPPPLRPSFWTRPWATPWDRRIRVAIAAAALMLLAGGIALWVARPRANFAGFREDLVALDWASDPHLDLKCSELPKVKAYLASRHCGTNFIIPPGLRGLQIQGCSVLELAGETVSVICLIEGPRHLHLFALDHTRFPDLPPSGAPDFEKCAGWRTATWSHGDQVYILTGLKFHTFVQKFRKGGRWTMSG